MGEGGREAGSGTQVARQAAGGTEAVRQRYISGTDAPPGRSCPPLPAARWPAASPAPPPEAAAAKTESGSHRRRRGTRETAQGAEAGLRASTKQASQQRSPPQHPLPARPWPAAWHPPPPHTPPWSCVWVCGGGGVRWPGWREGELAEGQGRRGPGTAGNERSTAGVPRLATGKEKGSLHAWQPGKQPQQPPAAPPEALLEGLHLDPRLRLRRPAGRLHLQSHLAEGMPPRGGGGGGGGGSSMSSLGASAAQQAPQRCALGRCEPTTKKGKHCGSQHGAAALPF